METYQWITTGVELVSPQCLPRISSSKFPIASREEAGAVHILQRPRTQSLLTNNHLGSVKFLMNMENRFGPMVNKQVTLCMLSSATFFLHVYCYGNRKKLKSSLEYFLQNSTPLWKFSNIIS